MKRLEISSQEMQDAVNAAYDNVTSTNSGKNADYIPYLAGVPSDLFGISVCMPSGEIISVGDYDYTFGIESISKVPTALLAMHQYGADQVKQMIGADATGLPFNSIMAILLENDHPSTPLVNAGAISACSMIKPVGDVVEKWERIRQFMEGMCGTPLSVIDELYQSEMNTNFTNRSIAWLLKDYNRIYDSPEIALDLYTKQCSIGVNTVELSTMAGTIANNGVNPVSNEHMFDGALSAKITSLMSTVGFYECTGDWMFSNGLPAKSGVGGGIMGVMPNMFGIAAFSPPLDSAGNSIKAKKAIQYIADRLQVNIFG